MRKTIIIVFAGLVVFCLSCSKTPEGKGAHQRSNEINMEIPQQFRRLGGGYTLEAELVVDSDQTYPMTVDQNADTASLSMDLPEGTYTLTLNFFITVNTIKVILATQTKTDVSISVNQIIDVLFEADGFDTDFDDDGDNIPNIIEANYGSDPTDPTSRPDTQCANGLDDDGDTKIDYPADPGCDDYYDNDEYQACNDGVDNDGDTLTDYPADPECSSPLDTSENNWYEIGLYSASAGGISKNSGSSYSPSLALDSSGNPVVAWDDNSFGNYEIYVRRWDGNAWVEIGAGSASGGGISNNAGYSEYASLALNSSGNPVVAWDDYTSGNGEIYVRGWNGSRWVEVGTGSASGGGISNNSGNSFIASLALDSSGNPAVAWGDDSSGNVEIYVRKWNGSAWIQLAGSATGGGISNNSGVSAGQWGHGPSLALDSLGNPVVAWEDNTSGNYEIYVKRWNGSAWVQLAGSASGGGISNNSGSSYAPSVALDSSGKPVVAWEDNSSFNDEIYMMRWNGSAWIQLGGSASGGGISNNWGISGGPSVALDSSGNPVVAWYDDSCGFYSTEIYVRRWVP